MRARIDIKKTAGAALAALLLCFCSAFSMGKANAMYIDEAPSEDGSLPTARSFAVSVPPEFIASDTPGRFVTEHYPVDAANITVRVIRSDEERRYTNAERMALADEGKSAVSVKRLYTGLTAEMYEEAIRAELDEGLEFTVTDFEGVSIRRASDGTAFPAYRIEALITGAKKDIYQTAWIVLSDDKILTVTYTQASDDEFDELFKKSAAAIQVY